MATLPVLVIRAARNRLHVDLIEVVLARVLEGEASLERVPAAHTELLERFDAVRGKARRADGDPPDTLLRISCERGLGRRLEPSGASEFRLERHIDVATGCPATAASASGTSGATSRSGGGDSVMIFTSSAS